MSDRNVCCLCGEEMDNLNSHNAYPADKKGGRCCTYCNNHVVIPMRLYRQRRLNQNQTQGAK